MTTTLTLKTATRGLSFNSNEGTSSRHRNEWMGDSFRAAEPELVNASIKYLTDPSIFRPDCPKALGLYNEGDLDKWERRTSGALLVGSNRPLLTRFIKGDDLKNQAAGTVRTVNAHFTYLNLSQLMAVCQRSLSADYYKSSIAELRDLGSCLEEAMAEKLITSLLQMSNCFHSTDEEGQASETFSLQERKFLGRRLILLLGSLAVPKIKGSSLENHIFPFDPVDSLWYVYCETANSSEARGFYIKYPELQVTLDFPPSQVNSTVYTLVENRNVGIVTAGSILTWHILSTAIASDTFNIQELVQHGKSLKSSSNQIRGSTNKKRMDRKVSNQDERNGDEDTETQAPESPTRMESVSTPKGEEEEAVEVEAVEVAEGAAEEEAEEWGGPVEYDEAVPTYYDVQQETYFYYGNVLYYDPDYETYYYYDWEQESYMYVDEETLVMINENTIPCWNAEDGQYYDASAWAAEGEEEEEIVLEENEEAVEEEESPIEEESVVADIAIDVAEESLAPGVTQEEEEATVDVDTVEDILVEQTDVNALEEEVAVNDDKAEEIVVEHTEETNEDLVPDSNAKTEEVEIIVEEKAEAIEETPEATETKVEVVVAPTPTEKKVDVVVPVEKKVDVVVTPQTVTSSSSTSSLGSSEPQSPQAPEKMNLPRAEKVSAPRRAPERFNHSIDQFKSSEALLVNRAMKRLIATFDDRLHLLDEWACRNNGTLRVGRNKRLIDGLMKGNMELKTLSATDCAEVASNLSLLNLAQLLYIRINAQNSAWDKSPVNTLKTFAMKTDSLIAERLVLHMINESLVDESPEEKTRSAELLEQIQPLECRHAGSQAVFILGALPELRTAQERILGEDGTAASWWYLSSSPFGGAVMPRAKIEGTPHGLFMRVKAGQSAADLKIHGQFDPPSNCNFVFKLVAGRGNAGFVTWDILEISL